MIQATKDSFLDVTLLEPRQKHPTIFLRFDELPEGAALIIHNDHDPKPLYYQLLGERGNIFTWDYLEQGPEHWRVRIGKRRSGEPEETIGRLVAADARKAQIFKKYGLDFCCGGKKTVKQACAEKGLDVTKVEQELQQVNNVVSTRPLPYADWNVDFLIDYIVNTHHSYLRKTLPDIRAYANKVMKVHGNRHVELLGIYQLVEEVSSELLTHLAQEENVLFPTIKGLLTAGNSCRIPVPADAPHSLKNTIGRAEQEHEGVGKALGAIRDLSANYTLPADACASYRLLYTLLQELEEDLHVHIHLENNILFPKALQLEK